MSKTHQVTIDGSAFTARRGDVLLDAALKNGIDLPYSCRAGHCGTCCVQLISGQVQGGEGIDAGVVHACQCRIAGDIVVAKLARSRSRSVEGELVSLRPLSREATEVQIRIDTPLPHHAGQYAQVQFKGFPARPFSITQPLLANPADNSIYFHVRRMKDGRVTPALGKRIRRGHSVKVTGPFGQAHFRPNSGGRLVLVGTSTGFAPIWSIAIAALREDPQRMMMVIAGGRSIESLYMAPALSRLARFPNVHVVPVCSAPNLASPHLLRGRPTDYLPLLLPTDQIYVCGAPGMVDSVKAIAAHYGAACHADPFRPARDTATDAGTSSTTEWLAAALGKGFYGTVASPRRRQRAAPAARVAEAGIKQPLRSFRA